MPTPEQWAIAQTLHKAGGKAADLLKRGNSIDLQYAAMLEAMEIVDNRKEVRGMLKVRLSEYEFNIDKASVNPEHYARLSDHLQNCNHGARVYETDKTFNIKGTYSTLYGILYELSAQFDMEII